MAIIFLFYCFQWEPVKYGTVGYPNWAHVIGSCRVEIVSECRIYPLGLYRSFVLNLLGQKATLLQVFV
jgi:hypothetical protein